MQLLESSTRVMDSLYRKVILRRKAVLTEKQEEAKPIISAPFEEKRGHLTLTLQYGEELKIGDALVIIRKRSPTQIKLSINAPKSVPIKRIKNGMAVERREPDKNET